MLEKEVPDDGNEKGRICFRPFSLIIISVYIERYIDSIIETLTELKIA